MSLKDNKMNTSKMKVYNNFTGFFVHTRYGRLWTTFTQFTRRSYLIRHIPSLYFRERVFEFCFPLLGRDVSWLGLFFSRTPHFCNFLHISYILYSPFSKSTYFKSLCASRTHIVRVSFPHFSCTLSILWIPPRSSSWCVHKR